MPITTFEGVPTPTAITPLLTTTCNLRCTYCYASSGDTAAKNMSLAVATRGIDFVAANAARCQAKTFGLGYHGGGEPFGNWSVMTDSLAYARWKAAELQLNPPVASAVSNGVLRDEQIDSIVDHLSGGMSVSFDGSPPCTTASRLTVEGRGTSERVIYTLRRSTPSGMRTAFG